MTKQYDLAVCIGRFQPFHLGHYSLISKAQSIAKNVLVLVGSSKIARNTKNPWSYDERIHMITSRCGLYNVHIRPIIDDLYSDSNWIAQVQGVVADTIEEIDPSIKKIALVGYEKDDSSYYLKFFPQWDFIQNNFERVLDATSLRRDYFTDGSGIFSLQDSLPNGVFNYLTEFKATQDYQDLKKEWEFIEKYKKGFEALPYPPIFVTTDAVVMCAGHILLVKRRSQPGKGLWALPGGFLKDDERIVDGLFRELREETGIKTSEGLLRHGLKSIKVFDAPNRSLRGRTITHAGLIVLHLDTLPTVKGQDDAEKARWVPINEIYQMPEKFFEDHGHIISRMISLADDSVAL